MTLSGWRSGYAITVAIGTALWWVLLLSSTAVRSWFLWPGLPDAVLIAFMPADIAFLVVVPLAWSARHSLSLWNIHRYATHYATLTTITLCVISGGGWLGAAMMVLASLGAEVVASPIQFPSRPLEARPSTRLHNAAKTLLQIVVMWSVFLALIPAAITLASHRMGIPDLPLGSPVIPWILFGVAGSTGVYCGFLFSVHGEGTPLPLDTTTRFVVMGPYRVIRNPMAVLGIFQGVMVGLILRSWPVVGYALAGAVAWHVLARPWEEADLIDRFGSDYERYRNAVHNWIPNLRPYPTVLLTKVERNSTDST